MTREIRIHEASPHVWLVSLVDARHPMGRVHPAHYGSAFEAANIAAMVGVCPACGSLALGPCVDCPRSLCPGCACTLAPKEMADPRPEPLHCRICGWRGEVAP